MTIEEGVLYVLRDRRDGKVIKGYDNEGVFVYWLVDPTYWEPIDDEWTKYYMEKDKLEERVWVGDLIQLN